MLGVNKDSATVGRGGDGVRSGGGVRKLPGKAVAVHFDGERVPILDVPITVDEGYCVGVGVESSSSPGECDSWSRSGG